MTPGITESLNRFYLDIEGIIARGKREIARQVNQQLTLTYWQIGSYIKQSILGDSRGAYGAETVKTLARKLTAAYGQGFGYRNLLRMVKFSEQFQEIEKVTTLSAQLSWSHFVELLKLEDPLKKEFYLTMSCNENWSIRTLRNRIDSMLYERTAISKKPEETIQHDLALLSDQKQMTPDLFLRDPYLLDFLALKDQFSERDLEDAILRELESFILEFGSDFAFMARQKRIHIGESDYYLDLLFFHRKLRRLVLIELKLGPFKPEYKGQVELYLRWLSKHEKQDYESDPIAIILCSGKDQEVVELMDLEQNNIHVSEYCKI